jgi:hypothetical protein
MPQCIVGDVPLSRTYSYVLSDKAIRRFTGGLCPGVTVRIRTSTNLPNPVADVDADMTAYRRVLLRGRLRVSNLLTAGNRFR